MCVMIKTVTILKAYSSPEIIRNKSQSMYLMVEIYIPSTAFRKYMLFKHRSLVLESQGRFF